MENKRQRRIEKRNDPEEENERQEVNLSVRKAKQKMLFYGRAKIALYKIVTQSKY